MYKEYHDAKKVWQSDKAQLVEENSQLTALRDQDKVKVQELKVLLPVVPVQPLMSIVVMFSSECLQLP